MPKISKNYIILIITLCLFESLSILLNFSHKKPLTIVDLSNIPQVVEGWYGKEIPVEENVSAILETESILMREYKKGSDAISLAIVYYKDSKVALHLPESCLTGQGSKLAEIGEEKIGGSAKDEFAATKIITTNTSGNLLMLYYFKTGALRTNSYKNMRLAMILSKIHGKNNGGALVRFMIPFNQYNKDYKLSILRKFIMDIDPILTAHLI